MRVQGRFSSGLLTIVIIASAAGMVSRTGTAAETMGPVQHRMVGTRHAENRLFIDAIASYTQAIRTNKGEISIEDIARVFSSRGLAYQALKEHGKALDDFSNAMRLDDRNPEFPMHRGRLYLAMGQYDRAREDLSTVLDMDPRNPEAYAARGKASLEAGAFDQAAEDLEQAVKIQSRNATALFDLGMAYRGAGKNEQALAAFDRLLALDPKNAAASYRKAGIYARDRKIDAACVWLGIAVDDGFSDWKDLRNDPDFERLRSVSCYLRILSGK